MPKNNFKDLLTPTPYYLCAEGNSKNLWDKYIVSVQDKIDDITLIKMVIYASVITVTGQLPTSSLLNGRAVGDFDRVTNEINKSFTVSVLERWLNLDIGLKGARVGYMPATLPMVIEKGKHAKTIKLNTKTFKKWLGVFVKGDIKSPDTRDIIVGIHTVKRK